MDNEKTIAVLNSHKVHWERLLRENICDKTEGEEFIEALDKAVKALEERPTAEWIDDDDNLSENTECSICNFYMLKEFKKKYKYCPNCGARMKESEEEE